MIARFLSSSRLPVWPVVALFAALTIVPLALLAFFATSFAADALTKEAENRVRANAEMTSVAVRQELLGLMDLVESYAGRPSFRQALDPAKPDLDGVRYHLEELQRARPGIATAFVTTPDGRLTGIVPETPSIVGKNFSFRDWYKGVTARKDAYVSEAYVSQAAGHPRVVAAAAPMPPPDSAGADAGSTGILVAAYGLAEVQRIVDRFADSLGAHLEVTDQRGVLLASPGRPLSGLVSRRGSAGVAAALRGEASVRRADAPGGRRVAAYVRVPGLGWTVTASVSEREAFAPVRRLRTAVFGITAFLSLALLAALALLTVTLRARRRAEGEAERAHELDAQLAAIVQSTDDAIFRKSADGTIQNWNPAAERLYGYTAEEAMGKPATMLVPPERAGEEENILRSVFAGNRLENYETERVHEDGTVIPVSLTVSPIRDDSGDVVAASSVARDISERRRAEAVVRQAQLEAERANLAKSEFLSRMSHELRTPLNAVLGFAQLLAMDDLEDGQRESLEQIEKAGNHLLSLINEVLDISRIEAGRLSLSLEPVSLHETACDVIDLLRPLASARAISLSCQVPEDCYVSADSQRLKQVLLNLGSNAIKYNHDRGDVRVVGSPDGNAVRIEVSDTGPGIPADRIARLFLPFDRLDADQSQVEGSGLGLALSKGLVQAMGGEIGVESRPGEGSTFWLRLQPAEAWSPADEEADTPAPAQLVVPATRQRTILYVEDNLSNMKLVERLLERRPGFKLLTALHGSLGLELAHEHRPDLILLDLHLPDIQGREVLARLKADPATRKIPVVVLSADATPRQIERLIDEGAANYLTKPLDVSAFFDVLDLVAPGEPVGAV